MNEPDGKIPEVGGFDNQPETQRSTLIAGGKKPFLKTKKGIISIVGAILLVIIVLFAIPSTRYAIAGVVVKKEVTLKLTDSETKKPVSDADVLLGKVTAKTNENGEAIISSVPVGQYKVEVSKTNYEMASFQYTVPILSAPEKQEQSMKATGRQVSVKVNDAIAKTGVAKALLTVGTATALTDETGAASIVLPADAGQLEGVLTLEGYNNKKVKVIIASDQPETANNFAITPAGSLYYLSKKSGTIDVVKSHLDGTSAKTVVKGTGNESNYSSSLLSTKDWKYLALQATRESNGDGKNEQLYLLTAATDKLTLIDKGNANFQSIGWSGHYFFYTVSRNDKNLEVNDGALVIKSFNAETGQSKVVESSKTLGNKGDEYYQAHTDYYTPILLDDELVYLRYWKLGRGADASKLPDQFVSYRVSTGETRVAKEFASRPDPKLDVRLYEPQAVYVRDLSKGRSKASFYEYEHGEFKTVASTNDKFDSAYPTYLQSPDGQKTFWSELRNGKDALFVGDKDGKKPVTLSSESEFKPYGWYTDKYVVLSKDSNELYIAKSDAKLNKVAPLKIGSYHNGISYGGYGSGYGGY